MKRALITGLGGQDAYFLSHHLKMLGYEVHGTVRGSFSKEAANLEHVTTHYADLRDELSLEVVVKKTSPDEIYNLAGQVFVPTSWQYPTQTMDVNVGGLARILSIVEKVSPHTKVYQASSSEMYGNATIQSNDVQVPVNEETRMKPMSPYGVSKLAAHKLIDVYRKRGLFAVSGILFNHESELRGTEMVTRKITKHVASWAIRGDETPLRLGNTSALRDWGYAGDYVKAMHLMLQQPVPEDYVIGYGKAHSVDEFLRQSIRVAGLHWEAVEPLIVANAPEYSRKNEVHVLVADYGKALRQMNWKPVVQFETLVHLMVARDMKRIVEANEVPDRGLASRV